MNLRGQLLLAAALVALLPLTAVLFLNPIERMLREGHEQAVAESANSAVAAIESFGVGQAEASDDPVLYLHPSEAARLLDGYADDWRGQIDRVVGINGGRAFDRMAEALEQGTDPVRLAAVGDGSSIALYLRAIDNNPVYADAEGRSGDAVRIALGNGRLLVFEPAAPGPIALRDGAGRLVRGYWQDRIDGWSLEIRLPRSPADRGIGIAVIDRGSGGETPVEHRAQRLRLVGRIPALDRHLDEQSVGPAWLIDDRGWVLAFDSPGDGVRLDVERIPGVFDYLMAARLDDGTPWSEDSARLVGPEIDAALDGQTGTSWLRIGASRDIRLRQAHPVDIEGARHVLVVERDAGPLLLLANRAVLSWLGASLAVFMAVALVLFGFVLVLTLRIRRLRNTAELAVERGGRVGALPPASSARDELGDLSRSLRGLLERLREHQRYLQTLADKLAHELRTPVSMVQSSLDNLAAESDPARSGDYLRRADQGAQRLRRIVQAMSQAARLEDSLKAERRCPVSLNGLVSDYVAVRRDEIRAAGRALEFDASSVAAGEDRIDGSEDLLAQMLDKIVDNALDFTPERGRIDVRLEPTPIGCRLSVENDGPQIDPDRRAAMFDSMVSWRASGGDAAHLGLGLYVARCIADYHGGRIDARSTDRGTAIDIDFPKAESGD